MGFGSFPGIIEYWKQVTLKAGLLLAFQLMYFIGFLPNSLVFDLSEGVKMSTIYISLLIIFAVFGAFCFNMGHRRAYRLVLKGLLRGQIGFISQRIAVLKENREKISQEDLARSSFSYETIGQLVIGWYKYFRIVRDDRELKALKGTNQGIPRRIYLIDRSREPWR